jgi:hypothetical protein
VFLQSSFGLGTTSWQRRLRGQSASDTQRSPIRLVQARPAPLQRSGFLYCGVGFGQALLLYNPSQLTSLVIRCLPSSSEDDIVVSLCSSLEDELRLIAWLKVDREELRQTDDKIAVLHNAAYV